MNECKLLIEENINKNKKINVINNPNPKLEMANTQNTLLDTPKSKIIILNLNYKTNDKINLAFNEKNNRKTSLWDYILRFNKKINQQQVFNNSLVKSIKFKNDLSFNNIPLQPNDNFIINLACEYLIKNGFNIEKEGIIEYWSFDLINDENNAIFYDVYKDDELFNFYVDTCIFYTHNDLGINGNLDYYKIEHTSPQSITTNNKYNLTQTNITKTNIMKNEIKISSNLAVLISGNQLYSPQPLYGYGKRKYVTVKLRSKRLN